MSVPAFKAAAAPSSDELHRRHSLARLSNCLGLHPGQHSLAPDGINTAHGNGHDQAGKLLGYDGRASSEAWALASRKYEPVLPSGAQFWSVLVSQIACRVESNLTYEVLCLLHLHLRGCASWCCRSCVCHWLLLHEHSRQGTGQP